MAFAVGPQAAKAGYRVRNYELLDSTNSEAMRLAAAGEAGPLWIVATEQTAGRGRQGRAWQSGAGNLATSLLIRDQLKLSVAATLGFVAGLAVYEACAAVAPGLQLALKWPNDVLCEGGKLAGLLLESQSLQSQSFGDELALVIGIGVNVTAAPEGIPYPAVSLAGLGVTVSAEHLFTALTDSFAKYHGLWDGGRGFGEIRRLWLTRAHGVGGPVSIHQGDAIEQGIFETLDEQGCLVLHRADKTRCVIAAGDVYFGDARTAHPGVVR